MLRLPSGRRRLPRALALLAFLTLVALGPLTENTRDEKLFTALLALDIAALLLFVTARPAFALIGSALLFGTIELASALKFAYLNTPLLAPDLKYFVNRDTLDVISRYPGLLAATVATVVIGPLLLVAGWRGERIALPPRQPRAAQWALRSLGALASAALMLACLAPLGPFSGVFNKPMWVAVNDRSFLTNFLVSFNDTQIETPVIPPNVDRSLGWTLERPLHGPPHRPDVIAILEESTFDPRILKVCTMPLCKQPMFEPDRRTRASGLLTVHTFGGGTWTSEFALLTGMAHTVFGNAGLYAPYNLAPRVGYTLPKAFKAAGYRAIAIYPTSGDFINARNAYAYYGFDAFYDGDDYGLGWKSTDAQLLAAFERIYAEEKQVHGEQPLFVFMLTLHQHGPHMTPLAELPSPYDKPLFAGRFAPKALDQWLNLNLGNYLERLRESDAMLAELQQRLWGDARPAILLHFGDHQPSFDGAIHAIPKQVPRTVGPNSSTVTYYMLKSNQKNVRLPAYPVLDIAFLGSMLLEAAGLPLDPYYQANTLLRERCKGRYLDCKDKGIVTAYHDYIFNRLGSLRPE